MNHTTTSESDVRARPRTSIAWPVLVSVVVHALLLVVLLTVALTVEPSRPSAPVFLDEFPLTMDDQTILDPEPPPIVAPTAPALDASDVTAETVSVAALIGSSSPSPMPTLGHGSGGGVASLLRSQATASSGVTFAGLATRRVQRIVYVVDGSGAMVTSLAVVLDELIRSVDRLGEGQRFAVVLFRNRPPTGDESGARYDVFCGADGAMLAADDRNKRRLRTWTTGLEPRGISNPSDGLRRAMDFSPDAVFLLARSITRSGPTTAWGVGRDEILAELDRENPRDGANGDRATVIKTIQFIDEDPTGTMQAIGQEHGRRGGEDGYTLLTLSERGELPRHDPIETPDLTDAQLDRGIEILSGLAASGRDTAAIFGIGVAVERADAAREAGKALRAADRSDAVDTLALLVRSRCRILLAADGDRSQLESAIADLDSAGDDAPSIVRLNLAIALLMRDQAGDAPRAATILDSIDPARDETLDSVSVAELLMARVWAQGWAQADELRAAMAGEPFRSEAGVDASLLAAAADVLARLAFDEADPSRSRRALSAWADLIGDDEIARDSALVRAGAAAATVAARGLSAELRYAVGFSALRGLIERDDALELLDGVAVGQDGPGWLRYAALRDSALFRTQSWERTGQGSNAAEAAERLLRYVTQSPDAQDRVHMLTLCLGLCERVMIGEGGPDIGRIERVYASAAQLAVESMVEGHGKSDRWVCVYARDLLTRDPADVEARDRALTLLDSIDRSSPEAQYAAALRLHARLINTGGLREALRRARTAGDDEQVSESATRLLAECDLAAGDAIEVGGIGADHLRADRADAMVELDAPGALSIYEDLIARRSVVPGGGVRLSLGRARAMLAANRVAEAFAALRDLTQAIDASTSRSSVRSVEYWHAWTILLELSASQGRPVAAHVAGLEEIDPELGGQPWRGRLRAAAESR